MTGQKLNLSDRVAAVRAVYDEIAEEYDERVIGDSLLGSRFSENEGAFIRARIAATDNALDLGCGTGRWTELLAQICASTVGVDISARMIERAEEKLTRQNLSASFHIADMAALPFPDSTFDVVVSMLALMHIAPESRARVFGEISRVLKPGGRLILGVKNALIEQLITIDRIATKDITDLAEEELIFTERSTGGELRARWHSFSPQELSRLCAVSGLQVVALAGNLPVAAWLPDELLETSGIKSAVDFLESLLAEVPPFNYFGYHLLLEAAKAGGRQQA